MKGRKRIDSLCQGAPESLGRGEQVVVSYSQGREFGEGDILDSLQECERVSHADNKGREFQEKRTMPKVWGGNK